MDADQDKLKDINIDVSANGVNWIRCLTISGILDSINTLKCSKSARWVKISSSAATVLSLCEVEIYGYPAGLFLNISFNYFCSHFCQFMKFSELHGLMTKQNKLVRVLDVFLQNLNKILNYR